MAIFTKVDFLCGIAIQIQHTNCMQTIMGAMIRGSSTKKQHIYNIQIDE